jgi:hypothetical protein
LSTGMEDLVGKAFPERRKRISLAHAVNQSIRRGSKIALEYPD